MLLRPPSLSLSGQSLPFLTFIIMINHHWPSYVNSFATSVSASMQRFMRIFAPDFFILSPSSLPQSLPIIPHHRVSISQQRQGDANLFHINIILQKKIISSYYKGIHLNMNTDTHLQPITIYHIYQPRTITYVASFIFASTSPCQNKTANQDH